MNRFDKICLSCVACLALLLVTSCASFERSTGAELSWQHLPSIPDAEGFAGTFAGVSHGALIAAGGANIVGDKWSTNFHKVWYDSVFVLENPRSQWRVAGKLPHPLGYGVSITTDDGLICIGGSDSTTHYPETFRLLWTNGAIKVASLPPLPKPCANFCGAKVGSTIYVAGGVESPTATNVMKTFWALDLAAEKLKWVELPPWPGSERMLAVAGVLRGEFYLVSGALLKVDAQGKTVREYLKDAYAFSPANGWRKIVDVPRAVTAAPSPALSTEQLLIMSGDDGANINVPPGPSHPGFSHDVLGYDVELNKWTVVAQLPFGRATAPVVEWNGHAVIPMGEVRPRERTSEVWWAQPPPRNGKDRTQ
ncbi:MAG: Kelch repeat-containing protein [Verrucomicrobiales bacterium]|nr:Kelch repeat-containing protein [Verrucomicrobiales bacterium]